MSNETSEEQVTEVEDTSGEQVVNKTEAQATEKQYSAAEERAMAQGWVPEDQYQGTGKWRSAEEFLDRGELFAKIDEQNRKLRNTELTLEEFKKHYKKVQETEFKKALAALKAEKKQALEEGNADRVIEIDEELVEARLEQERGQTQQEVPQEVQPNPHFQVWVNKNSWYQNDRAMRAVADALGQELAANGERNFAKMLDEIEKAVKKEFPHKFNNPNRSKPGAVETGGNKGGQSKDNFQLTDDESRVMAKLVRAGVMTKEEYIADIKAERGV